MPHVLKLKKRCILHTQCIYVFHFSITRTNQSVFIMKTRHVPCEVGTEVLTDAVMELEDNNSAAGYRSVTVEQAA
jgi:hypothetical protein